MANKKRNAIRIGFAAYNETEVCEFVRMFKQAMEAAREVIKI